GSTNETEIDTPAAYHLARIDFAIWRSNAAQVSVLYKQRRHTRILTSQLQRAVHRLKYHHFFDDPITDLNVGIRDHGNALRCCTRWSQSLQSSFDLIHRKTLQICKNRSGGPTIKASISNVK